MKLKARDIICALVAVVLLSCGGKGPQKPSRRLGQAAEPDTAQLALMEMNFRMVEEADKTIMAYALAQEDSYALYQAHSWLHFFSRGDESTPAPRLQKEEWQIHMVVYTLEGRMLLDTEQHFTFGKFTLPSCVELNREEFHHGTHARIIAPWYTAFGAQGTAEIPAFENVIIDLEIR